jgi:hypothetical protein
VGTSDPWPSEAELDEAYAGAYRPTGGRFAGPGDRLLRFTRSRLAERIEQIAPEGPVLDVGAGEGWLVEALGARAVGIERGDGPWPGGPWAAVIFWHSLEHLPAPREALRQAASELRPGGVVVLALPNAASLQAAAFGGRWLALDPPRHLVHVPAKSLLAGASDAGLRVERVSYWRGGQVLIGWLHGLVGLLPGHPSLYEALRVSSARWTAVSPARRAYAIAAGLVLSPIALACSALEVACGRGGSVYVEARRA